MKFDVVVGNPPYSGDLHLKFYNISHTLLAQYGEGVFVHPCAWMLKYDTNNSTELAAFENFNKHAYSAKMMRSIDIFPDVVINNGVSITHFGMKPRLNDIAINNTMLGQEYTSSNINGISRFGNMVHVLDSIMAKIKKHTNADNLSLHTISTATKKANLESIKHYVPIAGMIGTPTDHPGAHYSFFYKSIGISSEFNQKHRTIVNFDDITEATNCYNYLKTYFARFCLSIKKFDQNISVGKLVCVPWLDFTMEWSDDTLFEYFGITNAEQNFILDVIPSYY